MRCKSYLTATVVCSMALGLSAFSQQQKPSQSPGGGLQRPGQEHFVKTILTEGLDSPMELAIADDGKIFFTELVGRLSMYDPRTKKKTLIHEFSSPQERGVGLIGVALDPKFNTNKFIYLYYAPHVQDTLDLHFSLSRFELTEDYRLDTLTEKTLLTVPVQTNGGAHQGGSLAWDKNGNLYISTGDDTNPFASHGYAPIDERPGKEYFTLDAQRSASNTNNLKGKILRIHPEPDGSYTIPEGNLFDKTTKNARPEIYIMGARNPYRIALNPKTSVLYWGDIGPDAGKDSIQGPKGYDEFNQAKSAGNYGWPYFIGNNFPYVNWDFSTNAGGDTFDPAKPLNTSPNNTGLKELPPAMPAMVYYPYIESKIFPGLGKGGRCAIVGSFYTYDPGFSSPNKFPKYFDGQLFVADWMRNWVRAFVFDSNESFVRSESFMKENGDFRRPIDMVFGKDGLMYMLEYGSVYGAANEDARLVRIEYRQTPVVSKRKPVIDKTAASDTKTKNHPGKALMEASDCRACHQLEKKAVGPSYVAIANRYKKQNGAIQQLAAKIINGGAGSWGTAAVMSAHPQLTTKQAEEMVRYILSLTR